MPPVGPLDSIARGMVLAIEIVGALIIAGYLVAAVASLVRPRHTPVTVPQARLLVAEGAIAGLTFKLAATLLKTIVIHTWPQIAMFAAILALRTLLKRLFVWEQGKLRARIAPG